MTGSKRSGTDSLTVSMVMLTPQAEEYSKEYKKNIKAENIKSRVCLGQGWVTGSLPVHRNSLKLHSTTVNCVCIWTLRAVHCIVRISWLGSVAKTINFYGYRTPRDQRGGSTDPFRGGSWSCLPQTSATQPPNAISKILMQIQYWWNSQ